MLEFLALGSDPDAAREVAASLGATALLADSERAARAPFVTVVRAVTSDPGRLGPVATEGLYVIYRRQVKARPQLWAHHGPTPGVVAVFGLALRAGLSHQEGDQHWRDVHAPLALRHHVGMWDYAQCSVVQRLDGPDFDGFALCGFATENDLRHRFYDDDRGRAAIADDVASFADPDRSTRRVRCVEWDFRR